MKVLVLFCFLIVFNTSCFAQLFEIAEDRGYFNEFNNVIALNDSTLVLSGNFNITDSYFSGAYIKAIDKHGNLLWEYLTPLDTEVRKFFNLVLLPNGNVAALGIEQWCCDCSSPFFQMHIISPSGQLLAQYSYESLEFYDPNLKAALSGDIIAVVLPNNGWPSTYTLHAFGLDGAELWTYNFGENSINHLVSQGDNFLAFSNNQMRSIDINGMLIGSIPYLSAPERVLNIESGKTLALWDGEVYEIDSNLNVTSVFIESSLTDIENWLKNGDFIYVIAEGEIRKLNFNYEMVQCSFFDPLPYHNSRANWCNEEFCVFAGNKSYLHESFEWISSFSSGVAFSVKLDNEQLDVYPDADLRHLSIESLSSNPSIPNISGYIVNTGDIVISKIRINRFYGLGICNPLQTFHQLENIFIQPGDSLMFEMYAPLSYSTINGNPFFHCCVFSSSPSGLSDRNELNDIVCATTIIVGVDNILNSNSINFYPNPATNKITFQLDLAQQNATYSIFDLLGQVVKTGSFSNTSNPEIDIRSLDSGSYLLHLQTSESHYSGKFVVVR